MSADATLRRIAADCQTREQRLYDALKRISLYIPSEQREYRARKKATA